MNTEHTKELIEKLAKENNVTQETVKEIINLSYKFYYLTQTDKENFKTGVFPGVKMTGLGNFMHGPRQHNIYLRCLELRRKKQERLQQLEFNRDNHEKLST